MAQSIPLVLMKLCQEVQTLNALSPQKWLVDKASLDDVKTMQAEAKANSNFDPLSLRSSMWKDVETGRSKLLCKTCENAKVVYIQQGREEPPWDLWARIFQWLGPPQTAPKWRVFWFPASIKRTYPLRGEEVGPSSLNGGYSYPCRSDTIVVYRYEEATRVLLHEILHAACCDPHNYPLPFKEANTETWAELFLVALLGKGSERETAALWRIQSQWIANQNAILRTRFGVDGPKDYAWRYTVGREAILESLKIELPAPNNLRIRSSRLTSPELCP